MPFFSESWFAYRPEVNALKIQGPGSASMRTAASEWDDISRHAMSARESFTRANNERAGLFGGRYSEATAAKTAQINSFLTKLSTRALTNATSLRINAFNYEATRIAMVPAPVISKMRAARAAAASNPLTWGASSALDAALAGIHLYNAGNMATWDAAVGFLTPGESAFNQVKAPRLVARELVPYTTATSRDHTGEMRRGAGFVSPAASSVDTVTHLPQEVRDYINNATRSGHHDKAGYLDSATLSRLESVNDSTRAYTERTLDRTGPVSPTSLGGGRGHETFGSGDTHLSRGGMPIAAENVNRLNPGGASVTSPYSAGAAGGTGGIPGMPGAYGTGTGAISGSGLDKNSLRSMIAEAKAGRMALNEGRMGSSAAPMGGVAAGVGRMGRGFGTGGVPAGVPHAGSGIAANSTATSGTPAAAGLRTLGRPGASFGAGFTGVGSPATAAGEAAAGRGGGMMGGMGGMAGAGGAGKSGKKSSSGVDVREVSYVDPLEERRRELARERMFR